MTRPLHVSRSDLLALRCLSSRGFSLIEMLVAFAVGALVLVSLVSIVSGSMSVSRKSNNSLLAYNAAASALDMIGTDLECLSATSLDSEYLHLLSEPVGSVTNASRLMLLSATANDTNDPGQVRGVMYRLAYQDVLKPGGSNMVYGLYRKSETNAGNVFTNFLGQADLSQIPAFNSATNSLSDFLAGNVVDFQVRFYPQGSLTPINASSGDVVRMNGRAKTLNSTNNLITNGVATAEVIITVLEDAGAERLRNNSITLETAKQKYGHVLSRKIMLRTP